jgi:hypothetical protein
MINPAQDVQEKVVLFVDLLGFASLTEVHPIELNLIKGSDRPLESFAMILSGRKENPLTQAFTNFHRALKSAIDLAQMHHPLTAITFSDSAYVATSRLFQAVRIASYFSQTLIGQRVPVRAGIAYGTFSAVRFRSDVTLEGGDHAAHFLGTGVVRAHAAETCGIKGVRILLHPSAATLLEDPKHNPPMSKENHIHYVAVAPEESKNGVGVQYEIDYWRFKPTAELKAWHSLQDMWASVPQSEQIHYEATAQAVNRMRVSQGENPLKNLRRRTLPHVVK